MKCPTCHSEYESEEEARFCARCGSEMCSECAEDCPECGEIVCAACLTPDGCLICDEE